MADENEYYPILRAEAYGPSQGEYTHDTLYGPLGKLVDNDIAVSPDQQSRYPLGSFVDVYQAGKLVAAHQRVADSSYKSPGVPNRNTFEMWNGQDLGHAELRPASGKITADERNEQAFERYVGGAYEPEPETDPAPSLTESPEPEEAKPPQPERQRPFDTIRQNDPKYASFSDDQLLPRMRELFPDVPEERLKVYAAQPGGGKMIQQYQDRDLNPLEKFKKYMPDIATGDDEKDIKYMHDRWYPQVGLAQFKTWVTPPNPVMNFFGHLYDQLTTATVQVTSGTPKQTADQALKLPGSTALGIQSSEEAFYGKTEQMPQAVNQTIQDLYKTAGLYGWYQSSSDWMAKNVAGYGGARDWFNKFVNDLTQRGKAWEAQSRQTAGAIPKDPVSQTAGTLGQVIGSTPDVATSFGLGATGRAAALWGMLYEGTSAYGHAVENHQKNALMQGVAAAGFRQFAQYLINSGKGRIASGLANSFATVADAEVEKWMRGEPNDISKDGKAAAVGFLVPFLLMGRGAPQEAFMEAEPKLKPVPPTDLEPLSLFSYAGDEESPFRPNVSRETKPVTIDQPGKSFEASITASRKAVQEELIKAEQAHKNGDHDTAAEHIDRGFSLMPDEEKRQVGKDFIDKVDELSGRTNKKTLSEKDGLFNEYYFSGPPMPRGRAGGPERRKELEAQLALGATKALPPEVEETFRNNPEARARFEKLPPEDQQQYIKHAQNVARSYESTKGWRPSGSPLTGLKPGRDIRGYPLTYGQQDLIREVERYRDNDKITNEEYERVVGEIYRTRVDQLPEIRKNIQFSTPAYEMHEDLGNYTITKNGEFLYGTSNKQTAEKYFKRLKQKSGESYYAGIPFQGVGKAIKDWFDGDRPGIPILPKSAEEGSVPAQIAGQIVKREEAFSRAAVTASLGEHFRRAQATAPGWNDPAIGWFEKISGLRWGAPAERAMRFFDTFSKAELIQQFIDYQEKGAAGIKDPNARWLWQNVIGPFYDSVEKREDAYGVEYEHRDNYFYQLLTHPKDDLPRLQVSVAKATGGLPFVKPRQMRLVERLALGHEMTVVNPIKLMLIRDWMGERAIQKIKDMRQLEAQGYAWNTKNKGQDIPRDQKQWVNPNATFGTPNHESYYIDSRIAPVLNAKFKTDSLFDGAKGPYFKFFRALKGATAAKLSWSLFHPLHIMDIVQADVATDALNRVMAGKANWADAFNMGANVIPFVGSWPTAARAYTKYADLVNYLQGKGKLDFHQLAPDLQRDVKDLIDMGVVVETSEERQMQFSRFLMENSPKWIRELGPVAKLGFDLLGNPLGFNRWWFGTVTPRLKVASAMMRRDTLLKTRPELFQASRRADLLREYGKIHRDIEGRYGEMHYDNLLWPRMAKQVGTTFLLSLGWQIGMFRTMGDGVVDLTRNAAHVGELSKLWQGRARDPAARQFITNRMAFTAAYFARALMTGWAISYFLGGKKNPDMWDGMYPVVGHDERGKEKRVNMQYFIKDIPALQEYSMMQGSLAGGAGQMLMNKMNPMAMQVLQAATNKNYMGRSIGDLPQRMLHVLGGFEPMSFERMSLPGQTPTDQLLNVLGYSPSGRWTMRTGMQNRIIAEAVTGPGEKYANARDRYRQAFLSKDQGAIKAAHDELIKMQVTEKQIHNIQKTANVPTDHRMFQRLTAQQQESLWKDMTPAEKKEYWPLIKKELKESGRIR